VNNGETEDLGLKHETGTNAAAALAKNAPSGAIICVKRRGSTVRDRVFRAPQVLVKP